MRSGTLVLRSLTHYWRTHLAVLLGVMAGTAVISGALLVGDSVRDSLKQMSLDRLGGIDHALHSPRFFREALSDELHEAPEFAARFRSLAPLLIMNGALVRESADGSVQERAGGIRVYGVDERFADVIAMPRDQIPADDGIVLSHRVASQLGAKVGDELILWTELPATIPRESLLGGIADRDAVDLPLTVRHVLEETSGPGRFDLNPAQQMPLTVFVPLNTLQQAAGLDAIRRSKEYPKGRPARVNALVAAETLQDSARSHEAEGSASSLSDLLIRRLQATDLSLRMVPQEQRGYVGIDSEQMVLETALASAAHKAAQELRWPSSSVLVYLANELSSVKDPKAYSMYSIVAGIDPAEMSRAPFGPLLTGPQPAVDQPLKDNEIIINDWLADDLQVSAGDQLTLKYHRVGAHGELPEEAEQFTIRAVVSIADSVTAGDRGLTPEVHGITDAATFRDWKQPFQMDLNRVTNRDDDYWTEYRALPKAFVSLAVAQKLWRSRYGDLTSVRAAVPTALSMDEATAQFETAILKQLRPEDTLLVFQPVKWIGLRAAKGTNDFTGLFAGFSFFVIAAAMILIGLLFRLGIERRVSSIGLLRALGYRHQQVRRMMLQEGLTVAVLGGVIGSVLAVQYASAMIFALKSPDWWGGAIGTPFLMLSVPPGSLVTGFIVALLAAGLALVIGLRGLRQQSPRELLTSHLAQSSQTGADLTRELRRGQRRRKTAQIGLALALLIPVLGLAGLIPADEAFSGLSWQVVAFFLCGVMLQTSALMLLNERLKGSEDHPGGGSGVRGLPQLGFRNAARNRSRTVFSVGMIAAATFVIVAVAAGRRNPAAETPDFDSGNGGFALVAESSTPLLSSLNDPAGRRKLGLNLAEGSPEAALLSDIEAFSFRVRPGENASCLNLYQTQLPTVLGVPDELIARGGFRFIDQRKADYWKLLSTPREDGLIPVLGDMNTLMFSLKKGPGATIELPGRDEKLVVTGMFDSSVFQGVLLMSDANFQRLFPEQSGYRYFLLGATAERLNARGALTREEVALLSRTLESGLTQYGFDAERVVDRIAGFLIVQNTYLSTFQSLGGLGLLLGTLGLATVMLRNVVERRAEFALLRAVGFRRSSVSVLVLTENTLLLTWGLLSGTGCALLAMLPHLKSAGADTPWTSGAGLLGLVFVTGTVAALIAVREASRAEVVSTLRGE